VTVEAEIKARLVDPGAVRQRLDGYTDGIVEVYRDSYLDTAAGDLARTDRELRLRTIERDDVVRHLLTYKEPAVDAGTYLEVETAAEPEEVTAALIAVRAVVAELGVGEDELTTDTYTDAVRSARRVSRS
jgi:adenylate cyclase, class 2